MEEKIKELIEELEYDIKMYQDVVDVFEKNDCEEEKDAIFCTNMEKGANAFIIVYKKVIKKLNGILESEVENENK